MRYVLKFITIILPRPTKFCQYFILLIENFNLYSDEDGVKHIRIKSRPNKWHENDCPFCHKSCPAYDKHSSRPTTWRGLDWETVGRCVNRALHDLEPERSRRLVVILTSHLLFILIVAVNMCQLRGVKPLKQCREVILTAVILMITLASNRSTP